jgi:hypothetical protein
MELQTNSEAKGALFMFDNRMGGEKDVNQAIEQDYSSATSAEYKTMSPGEI